MKPSVTAVLVALLVCVMGRSLDAQAPFVRGEFNADGEVDIADPLAILFHLFPGSTAPGCLAAGDVDGSGVIDINDPLFLLVHLFSVGAVPAAPYPECGDDLTPESMTCVESPHCEGVDLPPEITEWTVPYSSSRPRDPYVGADGKVWFVGQRSDYAAFLDVETGEFERFDLPSGAGPHNLIVGDFVWYAGNGDTHIGKLDPATGDIDVLPMPDNAARDPHTLVFDQSGDIWFTVQSGNFVGWLTVATEHIDLIEVPTANARPYGIVVDSRGHPWIAEFGTNKLGTVDPVTLDMEEFVLPRSGARPRRLEVTSDDSVWYVDYAGGYLGRFVPSTEEIDEWPMPGGSGHSRMAWRSITVIDSGLSRPVRFPTDSSDSILPPSLSLARLKSKAAAVVCGTCTSMRRRAKSGSARTPIRLVGLVSTDRVDSKRRSLIKNTKVARTTNLWRILDRTADAGPESTRFR